MECFIPGRIIVAPEIFGIEEYERHLAEQIGMPFNFEYSIDDIISKYEDLRTGPEGLSRFGPLPRIARIPEGRENDATQRLFRTKHIRAACPDFSVRAAANFSIDNSVISDAISFVNAQPVGSSCGGGCTIAVLDSGIDPSVLTAPNALHSVQYDVQDPSDNGKAPSDHSGHGSFVARIINSIAPSANLVSIKTMTNDAGSISDVLAGLYLAATAGSVDLINLSLSISCSPDPCRVCGTLPPASTNVSQLNFFFQNFLSMNGDCAVMAAAGNGYSHIALPAAFSGIFAVGDFDFKAGAPSQNSAYAQVPPDRYVLAPGARNSLGNSFGSIKSYSKPKYVHGTSFATAFATGVAARFVCSIKGGACSGGKISLPPLLFPYLRDEFEKRADKSWPGYDLQKHGLGVIRY